MKKKKEENNRKKSTYSFQTIILIDNISGKLYIMTTAPHTINKRTLNKNKIKNLIIIIIFIIILK